jgi:hypothetical protein
MVDWIWIKIFYQDGGWLVILSDLSFLQLKKPFGKSWQNNLIFNNYFCHKGIRENTLISVFRDIYRFLSIIFQEWVKFAK